MDLFDGLHKTLGLPANRVEPPKSFFDSSEAKADEDLVALWREDGWASYGDGLFWTVNPQDFLKIYKEWTILPSGAIVFGRSAFGNLYLVHNDNLLRLDIQWGRLAELGPSTYVFLNSTIKQARFQKATLQSDLFKAVQKRLGSLPIDECYGLFPSLPLGGNEDDPKAYQRVKMREYLALLAQMRS